MNRSGTDDSAASVPNQARFEQQRARIRRARSQLHILVVEDDPLTQQMIYDLLSTQYTVTICSETHKAISEYLRIVPDMVLIDIELGDRQYNGLNILNTIRIFDPEAYIVMLSANYTSNNLMRASRADAGFVTKPLNNSRLLHYVHECQQRKSRDDSSK